MRRTAGRPAGRQKRGSRIATLLIVALLAVGGVYAHYWVRTLTYYPTASVVLPGGFSFSAVQALQPSRAACGKANRRFLEPLAKTCKGCRVAYARCRREIDGTDLLLMTEAAPSFYVVVAPGLRMRVSGPADQIDDVCDNIAAQLAASGRANASCLHPRSAKHAAR
ncbi:MAG: hypothetical protein WAU52_08860 [Burkholderiales bacterium]